MARYLVIAAVCMVASAAPPAPPHPYQHPAPAQVHHLSHLDYFSDNSDVTNYYNPAQQKEGNVNGLGPSAGRLETLEPDSEVELIPGAQQPQQPPQQAPVSPNLPGLIPGQRVFIVHMPVPGYRPGTIGGYQPVYIVAAGAQGNHGYTNGYQNAILVNPSGQVLAPAPYFPYHQGGNPGLLVSPQGQFNRLFDQFYQEPFGYQTAPNSQAADGHRAPFQLSQLVSLQGQAPHPAANIRPAEPAGGPHPKRLTEASSAEGKEPAQHLNRNAGVRTLPQNAQIRSKV